MKKLLFYKLNVFIFSKQNKNFFKINFSNLIYALTYVIFIFRGAIHKNSTLNLWGVPLPTDEPMVYRTQRYRYDELGQRPIQYKGYLAVRSMMQAIGTVVGMMYFGLLAYFSFTRSLLLKVI